MTERDIILQKIGTFLGKLFVAIGILWFGMFLGTLGSKTSIEGNNNVSEINNSSESVVTDDFGYGETAIGSSGLYVYQTKRLYNSAGCIESTFPEYDERVTDWEVTIVVDSCQETEYLIFKDVTTGNITSVERRKHEQTK